jgi:hypothetical protein
MQPGRPTKYTEEKMAAICTRLRAGCTRKDSAESVGTHYQTLWDWMQADPAVRERVERAEAECAVEMTALLMQAARVDAKFALEWLKRRRRDEWGDNLSLSRLSDEDVIALAEGRVPDGAAPSGNSSPPSGSTRPPTSAGISAGSRGRARTATPGSGRSSTPTPTPCGSRRSGRPGRRANCPNPA